MKRGNYLTECDDCGSRYFSEHADQQLVTHHKTCHMHQAAIAERAKPPVAEPVAVSDPPFEAADEGRRKRAKSQN